MIIGPDGNAWLTEGGQNAIARVDAKSKEVKLFPLPKEFVNQAAGNAACSRGVASGSAGPGGRL